MNEEQIAVVKKIVAFCIVWAGCLGLLGGLAIGYSLWGE